jgi:cytochrome c-type biogenesis protein
MESTASRREVFFHALAFVVGFSLVFVALGASVAFVGYSLNQYLGPVVKIGGIVVIVFGFQVSGVFGWIADRLRDSGMRNSIVVRLYLGFADGLARLMYTEGRISVQTDRSWGYLSSGLMGVFFSAGWIPCVGPVLAAIYLLASDTGTVGRGALLLLVYALGLGIPFLLTGAALGTASGWLRKMNRHLGLVSKITGIFLILLGVMLFSGQMTLINVFFVSRFGTGLASFNGGGSGAMLTLPIAFIAGLLSFLSPCVLPLIPAYIGYLSGTAVAAHLDAGVANAVTPAAATPAAQGDLAGTRGN